jgi:23S rRNA pseudouridine1911/1915/1917 synthase
MTETQKNSLEIAVPAHKGKERIDKFLAGKLPSVTRSKIKKLIDEHSVSIDGKAVKANHIIRPGEVIAVVFPPALPHDLLPEKIPLDIVYEDDHLLVVNKPAGLVVHPAYGNMTGTLVNALLYHSHSLSGVGGNTRPGLVHRLDKDTSGLLVVAKDDVTHVHLARQLAERQIKRVYHAVVWGRFKKTTGRIEAPLARHPKERTKMVIHENGKFAVTNYRVLEELPLMSYIELKLETGRTHQIRVHLSSLGHPVFSDSTYGGRGRQLAGLNQERTAFVSRLFKKFNRQMLHAKTLSFIHPVSQKEMTFDSPLPGDMQELLDHLRSSHGV